MKPLTKLYLKTFLLAGIPFGLVMMAFDFYSGEGYGLWVALFAGLFFGTLMSLGLVSWHKDHLEKLGVKEFTDESLAVRQREMINSGLGLQELYSVLMNDPVFGKMKIEERADGARIKTKMSWESWGEIISIRLKSNKGDEYEYLVSSRPKVKMTLVDFGKNLQNVNRVEGVMKKTL